MPKSVKIWKMSKSKNSVKMTEKCQKVKQRWKNVKKSDFFLKSVLNKTENVKKMENCQKV